MEARIDGVQHQLSEEARARLRQEEELAAAERDLQESEAELRRITGDACRDTVRPTVITDRNFKNPKGSKLCFPNGVFSDSSSRIAIEVNPFRGTKNV